MISISPPSSPPQRDPPLRDPRPRQRRLRWAIVVPHLIEIGVVTLGAVVLTHWHGRRLIEQMAIRITDESTLSVQEHFQTFASTPYLLLQSQARAIEVGLLDPREILRIRPYFWQQVQLNAAIQKLYYGDETGSFVLVQNQPRPEFHLGNQRGRQIFSLDQDGDLGALLARDSFDPRLRPWYAPALEAQGPTWSPIYVFSAQPVLGITATVSYQTPDGTVGVLGVDLTLSQLSEFLQSLRVGRSGASFIVDRQGELVASSSTVEPPFLWTPGGQERLRADRSADPLIQETFRQLGERAEDQQQGIVRVGGVRHYFQSIPLQDPYGLDWTLVVLLPETDFVEPIWANYRQTGWVALIVLTLGIISATVLYQQIQGSIQGLVVLADTLTEHAQHGSSAPQWQASPFAELDQLAEALYRMTLTLGSRLDRSNPDQDPVGHHPQPSVPKQDFAPLPDGSAPSVSGIKSSSIELLDPEVLILSPLDTEPLNRWEGSIALEQLRMGQTLHCCTQDLQTAIWQTWLMCPIAVDGELLGVLQVSRVAQQSFGYSEIRLLEQVAALCGLAIHQSHLYQSSQAQIGELERLNQLKDEFVSTVSHELRSPLSNVHMALGMLSRTLLPEKREQYLALAIQECERQIHFINDLLDLQRLYHQQGSLPTTPVSLGPYLEHLLAGIRPQMEAKQQVCEIAVDPAIHHDPALAEWQTNTDALNRILMELAHNAIKYTAPNGRIRIEVAPDQAGIRFGVGNAATIPADDLPRIFDKFYRIPHSDHWRHGGTGLGLALVKQLVTQMEGNLTVASADGWTQFWVWLPAPVGEIPGEITISS